MKLKAVKRALAVGCAVALFSIGAQAASQGEDINKLRGLVEQQKFDQAYQFASGKKQYFGHVQFDFLYGLAALNSGKIAEGLMALERHLSAVPANDRARLELARGYYELGAYPRARREFEFVLRYNPPASVRENIERYLSSMSTETAQQDSAEGGRYVELVAGYDSNVNAGTYNDELLMISGVEQIDDPNAKENSSNYASVKAGGQWMKRVDESLSVYAGVDTSIRHNPNGDSFDTSNLAGYVGFSVLRDSGLYKFSVSESQLWVDAEDYRSTRSLNGEYQRSVGDGYNLNGVFQYAELSHGDANTVRDSNVSTLGLGFDKRFDTTWPTLLKVQLTGTTEHNLARRLDLDKDMYGGQISLLVKPSQKSSMQFGVSAQKSEYGDVDVAFGTTREDDTVSASGSFNYLLDPQWLLSFRAQYMENTSNQALYEYRRWMTSISARYMF